MHIGKSYRLGEFIVWTRRQLYTLLIAAVVSVAAYEVLGLHWLTMPLTVVALLGTATSFIVGFKNQQTYSRTVEAQQIWTSILNGSRFWGAISRDFANHPERAKQLVDRHLAWLTALRYLLRRNRPWETVETGSNAEYRSNYCIPERESTLEQELGKYLPAAELAGVLACRSKAARVLSLQSQAVNTLFREEKLSLVHSLEMQKAIKEFFDQQGRAERLKNFPYPRQYAVVNTFFVRAFCALLPFGLLKEFDKLNDGVSGFMQGHMVWLVIPFCVMISWMYTSLEQVGQSTENPFEGGANDVPITQICRLIERDLREALGETNLPALPSPMNSIIL